MYIYVYIYVYNIYIYICILYIYIYIYIYISTIFNRKLAKFSNTCTKIHEIKVSFFD